MGLSVKDTDGGASNGMHGSVIYWHLWSERVSATRPPFQLIAILLVIQLRGGVTDPEFSQI